MRYLYCLLLYVLLPVAILRLAYRAFKSPAYRARWWQRFGILPEKYQQDCVWIHSVSVGETLTAAHLVRSIQKKYPHIPVLVTTSTPTAAAMVESLFGDGVEHAYIPYDLPGAVQRFLRKVKPRVAVIMEMEIWPNLFHACARNDIPLIVAGARMSERSFKRYARYSKLTQSTLNCASVIAAREESDAQRFTGLGAKPERVVVLGSLKFDISLPDDLFRQGAMLRAEVFGSQRPVLIAASTHAHEEEIVLQAFTNVKTVFSDALLVLVPRHPERFRPVAELCQKSGFEVLKRSEGGVCQASTDVFIGDTMGELLLLLSASDVCFMGGSLVPVGGHNFLEPVAVGVPVVVGPHMFNFEDISRLFVEDKAVIQVADSASLGDVVIHLLRDKNERDLVVEKAVALLNQHKGAHRRLEQLVEPYLASCVQEYARAS